MVRIYARMTEDDQQVSCGLRDDDNALDALIQELKELPVDTAGAFEILAVDDDGESSARAELVDDFYLIEFINFGEEPRLFAYE